MSVENGADLTAGVYQPEAATETPRDRLRRLERVLSEPGAGDCDLLVCPELFLSGYFAGDGINECAETQDGDFAAEICRIAREHQCGIVYGYPERDGEKIFNAALCAGPDGRILANHRKNLLPYDYEEKYFQTGQQPTTFELRGWKIGLLICYEIEFPETVRHHARAGCHLVVAPTALTEHWPVVAHRVVPSRAFENNVFVAYANHAGRENGNLYLGDSVIVSPLGQDLARAGSSETMIQARLQRNQIDHARARLRFLADLDGSCYR